MTTPTPITAARAKRQRLTSDARERARHATEADEAGDLLVQTLLDLRKPPTSGKPSTRLGALLLGTLALKKLAR